MLQEMAENQGDDAQSKERSPQAQLSALSPAGQVTRFSGPKVPAIQLSSCHSLPLWAQLFGACGSEHGTEVGRGRGKSQGLGQPWL